MRHPTPSALQGCLAHKKPPHPRTLQWDYAYAPVVVLGGALFLMSEVPLHCIVESSGGAGHLQRLEAADLQRLLGRWGALLYRPGIDLSSSCPSCPLALPVMWGTVAEALVNKFF